MLLVLTAFQTFQLPYKLISGTNFSLLTKNQIMPDTNNTEETKEQIKKRKDTPENVKAAHEQADKDIAEDADLSIHSPNDDLDEAETARLGDDKNDLGGRI
jgi:hypothetical protein